MKREFKFTIRLPKWIAHRWGHCLNKVDYKSEATAKKAVLSMEKKGVKGLSEYECQYCGGWHIGHEMVNR